MSVSAHVFAGAGFGGARWIVEVGCVGLCHSLHMFWYFGLCLKFVFGLKKGGLKFKNAVFLAFFPLFGAFYFIFLIFIHRLNVI